MFGIRFESKIVRKMVSISVGCNNYNNNNNNKSNNKENELLLMDKEQYDELNFKQNERSKAK